MGLSAVIDLRSCSDDDDVTVDLIDSSFDTALVQQYGDSYENLLPFPFITMRKSDLDDIFSYELQEAFIEALTYAK